MCVFVDTKNQQGKRLTKVQGSSLFTLGGQRVIVDGEVTKEEEEGKMKERSQESGNCLFYLYFLLRGESCYMKGM